MESTSTWGAGLPDLRQVRRVIVVVDVAESVRLVQEHGADFIERWRCFVHEVRHQVAADAGRRLVKSLGDGLMLEFEDVPAAVSAALDLQQRIIPYNRDRSALAQIGLRIGADVGDVVVDELDTFGTPANLAARLAGLARPGEIVVSADVVAGVAVGVDVEVEDLGDCWLKHVDEPVRAARISPVAFERRAWRPMHQSRAADELIGVAILPFAAHAGPAALGSIGDLIADDVIAQLSRLPQLRVISRLSTSALRRREIDLGMVSAMLGVQYVVHGYHVTYQSRVRVQVQLVECERGATLWADSLSAPEADLMQGGAELTDRLVAGICTALIGAEVRRACQQPLPNLSSYTILLGAIALLHSLSRRDFDRAREMLVYLVERHPGMATPRAWLGLWHVMRIGQGWTADKTLDAAKARQFIATALDLDPGHSLSLAMDGLVAAYVHKDLGAAGDRYDAALKSNPNEGLAWLFRSAWHAYREEGTQAVDAALMAQSLSPLDPMRYYYDNFTSTAMLSRGDLAGAIDYGRRSLRANRMHGPTLRILAIAHALAGEMDAARDMVRQMLALEPTFTVGAFRSRYPGERPAQVERYAEALAAAGLPR